MQASVYTGDHVRRRSKGYSHHMLIVKVLDNTRVRVIHYNRRADKQGGNLPQSAQGVGLVSLALSSSSGSGSLVSALAEVLEEEIVLDLTEMKVELIEYNMTCHVHEGMRAIERARSRIGEKDYSLLSNNCETFINWVKINTATSKQVQDAASTIATAVKEAIPTSPVMMGMMMISGAVANFVP